MLVTGIAIQMEAINIVNLTLNQQDTLQNLKL